MPQHGAEDLGRAHAVGADGQLQHAVVVAGTGDVDGAGGKISLVRQRHRGRIEGVAAGAVVDAGTLQHAAQQQSGLHPGDEDVLARHDVADLVDQMLGQAAAGLEPEWGVDDPQQDFGRAERDVVVTAGQAAGRFRRHQMVVPRHGQQRAGEIAR